MTSPDTLLMLSGGLDSAYCLWQRVQAGLATHVHHVALRDSEGRQDVEETAARNIVLWHYAHGGAHLIEYTESAVDFGKAWIPPNCHTVAFWAGAILASPTGRGIRELIVPRHLDAFDPGPAGKLAAEQSDAVYRSHISAMTGGRLPRLAYPIAHMRKSGIVAAMPPELVALCWWCRWPQAGQACHSCHTCRQVDRALDHLGLR